MRLFTHNGAKYRLLRTIVQAVIGILLVNGGDYILQIMAHMPIADWLKPILVAVIMAVLAAVMPYLGNEDDMGKPELDANYWEDEE